MPQTSKLKVTQAIVVEGKYDKIKLDSFIDGVIIQTDGFRIFKDKEKRALLKVLADTVGLLVLTDSDVAGFKIRNLIKSVTKNSPNVTNVYIPQIIGKEKRKSHPSKEGTLGVEGMDVELLKKLLSEQQISCATVEKPARQITKIDFYNDGLCGGEHSAQKREQLIKALNLPSYLSTNALLPIMNVMLTFDEYQDLIRTL